jgi:hypothetical protein
LTYCTSSSHNKRLFICFDVLEINHHIITSLQLQWIDVRETDVV